jgi:hypothetical protein
MRIRTTFAGELEPNITLLHGRGWPVQLAATATAPNFVYLKVNHSGKEFRQNFSAVDYFTN